MSALRVIVFELGIGLVERSVENVSLRQMAIRPELADLGLTVAGYGTSEVERQRGVYCAGFIIRFDQDIHTAGERDFD